MDAAKYIHKEVLPIWHFFVDILCCIHIFSPQKTHNATLFYRRTCIQGRRHFVTAATSVSHAHTDRFASQ
jgi:hypothetical protein